MTVWKPFKWKPNKPQKSSNIKALKPSNPHEYRDNSNPRPESKRWRSKPEKGENLERKERNRRELPPSHINAFLIFWIPNERKMHPTSAVDQSNLRRMVCMMTTDEYCEIVLRDYPEYISSDQMYRICHISKRTCRYLLETGLVPNIDSGKKTRRFKIKTTDVVSYLNDRENNPLRYKAPDDYYKTDHKAEPQYPYGRPLNRSLRRRLRHPRVWALM